MNWKDKIRNPNCTLCPLHEEAQHVCLMGSGTRKTKVMIIGEAPGEREDETHQAFVGRAGELLRKTLSKAGLDPEECYITNVAKCRPPENRAPELKEIRTCVEHYLTKEVEKVAPNFILLLGNSALRGVVRKSGITKHRGTIYEVAGAQALATFHPAYVLRSPYHGSAFVADVQRFSRLVRGDLHNAGKTSVRIIRTAAGLRALRRKLLESEVISYDIETNYHKKVQEYSYWHPDFRIVSISFSVEEGSSYVVPIHHPESPWKDPYRVLRFLKPCLERTDCKYVAHNGKFDALGLSVYGIFIPQTFDTMLSAHMLEENRLKGLEPLSEIILGVEPYKINVGDKGAHNFPLRQLCIYNGQDTDYTFRLRIKFVPELKAEPRTARVFAKLMMPASNALTVVERNGVWIDPERYKARLAETVTRRDRVEKKLRKSAGDINLRSPQQVARWLFDDLGLPIIETTKSGAPSTNERVILRLAKQSPQLRLLLKYRNLEQKYIRTYFAQWANVDENSRFHPGYKLFGTVTGRISGDFQQVPRDPWMRSIIGAPPGWVFVEADFSQVELRLAAWVANVRRLLRIFAEGRDAHLETAVQITGKRPQDITTEERKHGKSVNFGFLYSMGPKKFVEYAFQHYQVELSLEEARAYYRTFHETYPEIRKWHDRQRRLAHRYQRVSSPIGRVRHLPTVLSSDRSVQAEAERQAINSPIQSCASDLMLLSLVRLQDLLPSNAARIVGTVHDSILFELRESFVEEGVPIIRRTMEDTTDVKRKFGTDITVPIEVEIKVGSHWGEGKVWKDE